MTYLEARVAPLFERRGEVRQGPEIQAGIFYRAGHVDLFDIFREGLGVLIFHGIERHRDVRPPVPEADPLEGGLAGLHADLPGEMVQLVAALLGGVQVVDIAGQDAPRELQVPRLEVPDPDVQVLPVHPVVPLGRRGVLEVYQPEPEPFNLYPVGVEKVARSLFPSRLFLAAGVEETLDVVPAFLGRQGEGSVSDAEPLDMDPFILEKSFQGEGGYDGPGGGDRVEEGAGGVAAGVVVDEGEVLDHYGVEGAEVDLRELDPPVEVFFKLVGDLPHDEGLDSGSLDEEPCRQQQEHQCQQDREDYLDAFFHNLQI